MDETHLDPTQAPPAGLDPLHDVRSLGGYHILRRLGEGGTGAVYLAYQDGGAQVALKVLDDRLAANQHYLDRFYREAKIGALLDHPNIVRRLDVGRDKATGKHFLVLEFVDGPSARGLLEARGRLPVGDAVHIALSIARALEYAHSRNIVHRDIKPDNILITRSGVSKLADLSLARRTDEASHLTAARQGFGTTHYMPYEQAINARHADGRSDIYALGATLYHLVTGSVPFPGENHLEVVEKKNQGDFIPASVLNSEVPEALDRILARMMARLPRDRYQTVSELIVDLERSRLAADVPTFADPERARDDPWMKACQAAAAEPTRLDPDAPPRPKAPLDGPKAPLDGPKVPLDGPKAPPDGVWLLRFRNRAGRLCKVRATTGDVLQRLRAGQLPAVVEARRPEQKKFRPLLTFDEFQDVQPAARSQRRRRPERPRLRPTPSPAGLRWALILSAAAVVLIGAFAAVFLLFRG